jgi:hypothetical protein
MLILYEKALNLNVTGETEEAINAKRHHTLGHGFPVGYNIEDFKASYVHGLDITEAKAIEKKLTDVTNSMVKFANV